MKTFAHEHNLSPASSSGSMFQNTGGTEQPWYKSLARNIDEILHPPNLPPMELTSHPVEGSPYGDLLRLEQSWVKSLLDDLRDFAHPVKLAPLQTTSKPLEIAPIWGAYSGARGWSTSLSVLIHTVAIILMLLLFQTPIAQRQVKQITDIYFPVQPYQSQLPPAAKPGSGGGGGGMHNPKPVSRGEAPKFAPKQFVPPSLAIEHPKLPVVPTITAVAPQIVADQYGDPLSKVTDLSGGPGSHGLGSGSGGGIGSGTGNGYGVGSGRGMGGGVYQIGGEVSAPVLLFKLEPEYSEEARKARYQGSVLLSIVVGVDGLPHNIIVIRPLGLGLDEKAIEAVAKWRFRPGMKGGHTVATQAQVEVRFRLL